MGRGKDTAIIGRDDPASIIWSSDDAFAAGQLISRRNTTGQRLSTPGQGTVLPMAEVGPFTIFVLPSGGFP